MFDPHREALRFRYEVRNSYEYSRDSAGFGLSRRDTVPNSLQGAITSQVHNFQKLKNISLIAVNFLATKTKVTCLSETVFFHLHFPELLQFSRPCE